MTVPEITLSQLGGYKFITMTGSNHFWADGSVLGMNLVENQSGANRLTITWDKGRDSYTMRFYHYSHCRYDVKTGIYTAEQYKDISLHEDIYCDQLQEIFTRVTGLDTRL